MVAGMRMRVSVHSIGYGDDDEVGGAQTTGTLTIREIPATIQYLKPNMLLMQQQGVEIRRMARVLVQPGSLVIYERDELEIVGPPGHEDLGKKLRVESVDRTGFSPNDSRGRFLVLTCERIEFSRDDRVGMQ